MENWWTHFFQKLITYYIKPCLYSVKFFRSNHFFFRCRIIYHWQGLFQTCYLINSMLMKSLVNHSFLCYVDLIIRVSYYILTRRHRCYVHIMWFNSCNSPYPDNGDNFNVGLWVFICLWWRIGGGALCIEYNLSTRKIFVQITLV